MMFVSKLVNRIIPVLLVVGLVLGVMTSVQAAPAATASVGVVDFFYLVNHHPDTPKSNDDLKAEHDKYSKEFTDKSATLNDADKRALEKQLNQQLEQKRQDLLKPISDQIFAAIKDVADSKGLSVVVSKGVVIYGGVDITADVLQKIGGK